MSKTANKKSVLFIMETLHGGGAERVLIDLLRHFDYSKFEVTLLLVFKAGIYLDQIPPQVRVRWIWPKDSNLLNRILNRIHPLKNLVTKSLINRALRGLGNFDTIVSYMEGVAMHAHSLLLTRAKRNVTWVHINLIINAWTDWVFPSHEAETNIYSKMDAIVFVSRGAMLAFEEKFGEGIGGTRKVVYNVIDREEIIRKSQIEIIRKDRPMILTIGRLNPQKRHDRLLHAAKLLRDRGLDFTLGIIGTGNILEAQTKELAASLGLSDIVTFYGFKSNPYPYLREADIFVLTSDTEGFPTVVCEAMCLGKPIVSTNITGTDELLSGGIGLLTDLTPEAVADGLEKLLRSPELRAELSAKALAASERFSVDAAVKEVEKVILGE